MAARRVARTARQRAASRRNVVKAQKISAQQRRRRNVKRAVIGGAVVGGVVAAGGVAYKQDRKKNVYLYHNTGSHGSKQIRKHGFQGGDHTYKDVGTVGRVYFAADKNTSKMYGNKTLRVRMNRKQYANIHKKDPLSGKNAPHQGRAYHGPNSNYVTIHEKDLKGVKVRRAIRYSELTPKYGAQTVARKASQAKFNAQYQIRRRRR